MTSLTERYLAATLRGIPEKQRPDVDRELRSSIADAVEDRVAAGEDRVAAETAVLEELGNPTRLAAGMTGRPPDHGRTPQRPRARRAPRLLRGRPEPRHHGHERLV